MKTAVVLPVFSVAFAVISAFAVVYDSHSLPVTRNSSNSCYGPMRCGPSTYWYGWIVTSMFGASLVAFLATALRRTFVARIWSGFAMRLTELCAVAQRISAGTLFNAVRIEEK